MSYFSIFNSSGEHIGDVYSHDGGASPSLIVKLINAAVTSALATFILFGGNVDFTFTVLKGMSFDNISSDFLAFAAFWGIIVFSFLISDGYNVSLPFAVLKATLFIIPGFLEAIAGLDGSPVVGFILTAILWLFTIMLIALGAAPAFLIRMLF